MRRNGFRSIRPVAGLLLAPGLLHALSLPAQGPGRNAAAGESDVLSREVGRWIAALPMDPGVSREMARYQGDRRRGLREEYGNALSRHLRTRVGTEAEDRIREILRGSCTPFSRVTFGTEGVEPPPDLPGRGSVEGRFLDGFTKVESVACFTTEGITAEEALRLYTSPDFRRTTESRIRSIREEGDRSCVDTDGVPALLAPSRACNRITWLVRGPLASEHSQVVSNGEGSRLQPVYFKESVKTFVEIPGGLALHYVNYTRSAEMGSLSRSLGRRAIQDAEERRIREFQRRLSDPAAPDPATPDPAAPDPATPEPATPDPAAPDPASGSRDE